MVTKSSFIPSLFSAVLLAVGLVGCSCASDGGRRPARDGGGFDALGSDGMVRRDIGECEPTGGEGTPETCADGVDNDCDGRLDCSDLDCSGVGDCPVCGEVETPLGAPLALPDGVGGADCSGGEACPADQRCFTTDEPERECRESYRSTLNFIGFGPAVFDSITDIRSVCVVMEHSWIRDLEIALEAPNGSRVRLQEFLGQEGGEIYLGQADDCDDDGAPTPGVGARYCWTPTASRPSMLDYANGGGAMDSTPNCIGFGDSDMMPPGDYSAADDWGLFTGSPLNGEWTLSVTDLWGIDNGYIFEWSIAFDPVTVEDCSSPLI